MIDNFIKPDPSGLFTKNEHDTGANFLRSLKGDGVIDYNDIDLSHVSGDWYEDEPPTKKLWFDSLHQPMLVKLTKIGEDYLLANYIPLGTRQPIDFQTFCVFFKAVWMGG